MPNAYYSRSPGPAIVQADPPGPPLYLHYLPEQHNRSDGGGGWVEVEHARGDATTEWRGRGLHRMTFDLFFDSVRRLASNADVEGELSLLDRFARRPDPINNPLADPPRLRLTFGEGQQLLWVMESAADVLSSTRSASGRRVQATVRVSLLEFRRGVQSFTPLEQAAAATGTATTTGYYGRSYARTYTVRSGDTLTSIAARQLGSASRWSELYDLNSPPLEDPDLLTVGQILQLPAG